MATLQGSGGRSAVLAADATTQVEANTTVGRDGVSIIGDALPSECRRRGRKKLCTGRGQ
jgi:hypothetical protein